MRSYATEEMKQKWYRAVALREMGLAFKTIADLLGISIAQAKQQVFRGRKEREIEKSWKRK